MAQRRREDRTKTVLVSSLLVSVLGFLVYVMDGFRCLGGDCETEWWIWALMLGPVPVALAAAAWRWGR